MTQPLTDDQLAAIRDRADAATANPVIDREPNSHHRPDIVSILTPDGDEIADRVRGEADAELWQHARADVLALLAEIDRYRERLAGHGLLTATNEQLLAKARDARAENDKLRRENQRLRAVADQYEAAIDRVNNACDAIEDHWRGDYDDDAEGARDAVARIRAAADDPQP